MMSPLLLAALLALTLAPVPAVAAEIEDAESVTGLYAYVVDNDLYREKCGL